ncbi:PREDICTED: uncharacterized protein LOC101298862 [Fragaria vesca subsp. vesca]
MVLGKDGTRALQLEEGDIIDWINIKSQPAVDNPLLKNHKIQLQPTSFPAGTKESSNLVTDPTYQTWCKQEACPFGTVPIHRTTKEDLVMAKTLSHHIFNNISSTNDFAPNNHKVFVRLNETRGIRSSGLYGMTSVYKPSVAPDQSTAGTIWVGRGLGDQTNLLMAGWMISHSINGDDLPRLFVYWTVDGGHIGCFNLLCHGFVQVDRKFAPKRTRFEPLSTVGGKTYEVKFAIHQDPVTANWWLTMTDWNITVGYWPKEILPHLRAGAGEVGWGGLTMATGKDSPPMGSGQYPDGTTNHAAYFRNLHYLRAWNKPLVPSDKYPVFEFIESTGCYGLQNDKGTRQGYWGYSFLYGGPGGSC